MTSRKKPGVAFWATVGLVVALLYVLSIGPLFRLIPYIGIDSDAGYVWRVYAMPCEMVYRHGPQPIHNALDWYIDLWL